MPVSVENKKGRNKRENVKIALRVVTKFINKKGESNKNQISAGDGSTKTKPERKA